MFTISFARSSNGRTAPSGGVYLGSNPGLAAMSEVFTSNFFTQFCQPSSQYFGGWFIGCEKEKIESFLSQKPDLELILRHLVLYLESAQILKTQVKQKSLTPGSLYSKQLWYQIVLLLLTGVIDQSTNDIKRETKDGLKTCKFCERFLIVMDCLDQPHKDSIKMAYFPTKKFTEYSTIVRHICSTRNFFAHEFDKADNNTPEDASLTFNLDQEFGYVLYPNLPHGKLFCYIVIALFKYLKFSGRLSVETSRTYKDLVDFISDEA